MKLALADPSYLKESISIISDLVNEAHFKISNNGIELVAMDPANVAMVIFKLLPSCFSEYQVSKDVSIAINLANLKQILRRAKTNDMVTLEITQDNKLQIQFKSNSIRTFSLPLIEMEEKEQRIPPLEFPVSVIMESARLTDAIEDVDIVADAVQLSVDNGSFVVSAEGDLSNAHIELKEDQQTKIVNDALEKVKSKYSIEYLKKMIAGAKLAPQAEIRFSRDYPLRLDYKVVDRLLLSFILAPRVEND
ncbi:proliferating cell nuclear antigen (pcna) [Candidatus Woesearchaeota archaeon]|nr:proliferating cell nuclear antigen (pcna) [Candidatus Woesearchaeota archaeon]